MIIPRPWKNLSAADKTKIEKYCRAAAMEAAQMQCEKDGRIMLDLYTKMTCVILHDAHGFTEDDLLMFLGNHKRLFNRQARLVRDGEQIEYINKRMAEIFPVHGFPQSFFDGMLGAVPDATKEEDIELNLK